MMQVISSGAGLVGLCDNCKEVQQVRLSLGLTAFCHVCKRYVRCAPLDGRHRDVALQVASS